MKLKFVLWLAVLLIYLTTSKGPTPYNYFSRLGYAFSKGQIYITTPKAPELSELIPIGNDQYIVPYAPLPAFLITPLSFLTGNLIDQTLFTIILGSLIPIVTFMNIFLITKSKQISLLSALFAGLGTNLWFNSVVGSSWYLGQVASCLMLSIAIWAEISKKSAVLSGVFLGLAYLGRPHVLLSIPFFVFINAKNDKQKTIKLALGIIPSLVINAIYNWVRFGVIWDKGYTLIPGVLSEPWYEKGIFHISYIPRHIEAVFVRLPLLQNTFPYLKPDYIGMAIWVTSPLFIILFKTDTKNRLSILSIIASLLIFIPIAMHGTIGFTQFGYRFAIDFYPFLFLLVGLVIKKSGIKPSYILLLIFSIVINFWGIASL